MNVTHADDRALRCDHGQGYGRAAVPPTPRVSPARRLWHTLRRLWGAKARVPTAEEHWLAAENGRLRLALADRDRRVLDLETDIEKLTAKARVHEYETLQLVAVIERDRLRVEAEQARYAAEAAGVIGKTGRGA